MRNKNSNSLSCKFDTSWTEQEKQEIKQLIKIILQAILAV